MTNLKTTLASSPADIAYIKSLVRDVPDFPKKGIIFKDITPVLKDKKAFKRVVDAMIAAIAGRKIDYLLGIESRGFIFSAAVAYELGVGFVPVRKVGKLPYKTEKVAYALEYGEAVLEIHQDSLEPGASVVIMDDLLATGGTAKAAAQLVEKIGGKVALAAFVIELDFLKGRNALKPIEVVSLIQY